MFSFFIGATLVTAMLLLVGLFVANKTIDNNIKPTPFECGFEPFSVMRRPFSLRYFILLLLFLLFDVETTLLFPCLTNLTTGSTINMYFNLFLFLLLLFASLLYEWKNGLLSWI